MKARGTVREWNESDGWGVIDSPATPGGCWAHFSNLDMQGFRKLQPGQGVDVEFEPVEQDGYSYRAVHVRPDGADPLADFYGHQVGQSGAFSSSLHIDWDAEDE